MPSIEQPQHPGMLKIQKTIVMVRRFADGKMLAENRPYNVSRDEGNVGLNEGIQLLWDMAIGLVPVTSGFHSGAARVGVGSCSGVEAATDTGLWSGHGYRAMDAGYPIRSGQACAWRGTFAGEEANALWNEFTVARASGDAAGVTHLFHKNSFQGTKISGQSWELTCQVNMA